MGTRAEVMTAATVSLPGNRLSVKVTQAPLEGWAAAALYIYQEGDDALILFEQNNLLVASHRVAGSPTDIDSMAYEPGEHIYWGIREQADNIVFETSSSGDTWFPLTSEAVPFVLSPVGVKVGVYLNMSLSGDNPGDAHFDDLVLCGTGG
jgi:hypothetical protein